MARIQRVALVLVSASIALQSGCRNLDGEPSGEESASGGTAGDHGGVGGTGGNVADAGHSQQGGASGEAGDPGASGNAGSDGDGGSHAVAGSAGSSGTDSGSGGSGGSGALAGATDPDPIDPNPEEVAVPGCVLHIDVDEMNLMGSRGLAANLVPNGQPYVLYATDPQANAVLMRFRTGIDDTAAWTDWECFDSVVHPEQISATTVYDSAPPFNTPEVYATNAAGRLFVRRFYKHGWAPWLTIGLPRASSHLIDVSAWSAPDTPTFLYVLDNGRLFSRRHVGIQAYSNYTPWREVSGVPKNSVRLCAGLGADRRQQLFVSTASGDVYGATQTSSDIDAAFGAFEPAVQASTHAMTDIDCSYLADGTLTLFGLSSGLVWYRSNEPDTLDWLPEPVKTGLTLAVFTVANRANLPPTVFGIDPTNLLWWHVLGTSTWTPIL